MNYISTRGNGKQYESAGAIIAGLSEDGGLFVPESFPSLDVTTLVNKPYEYIAAEVLKLFLTDFDPKFIEETAQTVYGSDRFNSRAGHLTRVADGLSFLELWHGPTFAFKDYALQILPHLMCEAKRMTDYNKTNLILVATSGDTGSAALYGFSDLPGIKVMALFPQDGVSLVQRRQMTHAKGENLLVFGVEGNFDDIQSAVKNVFSDSKLADQLAEKNVELTSANSINFGRLVPQICYYFSSYASMLSEGSIKSGECIDFVVPTGNFGDILAGYYAKQMGLPVGKLICASNKNRILTDFFTTGIYDTHREFHKTNSPSMDILISSNLERLLYHVSGDCEYVKGLMNDLKSTGVFKVTNTVLNELKKSFFAGFADDKTALEVIRSTDERYNYLCDPHTAVAVAVAKQWNNNNNNTKNPRQIVVLSTASPYKFPSEIIKAFDTGVMIGDDIALSMLKTAFPDSPIPMKILDLMNPTSIEARCITTNDIDAEILKFMS